jgi:antitoxin PrlF
MTTATMTSKGQITIPAEFRERYRLAAGSKVDFVVNAAGDLVMRPKTRDVRELRGSVKYDGPPVSVEEINQGIAAAVAERVKRG